MVVSAVTSDRLAECPCPNCPSPSDCEGQARLAKAEEAFDKIMRAPNLFVATQIAGETLTEIAETPE